MLLLGTEAQRPGLAKEGMLGAYRGEAEFRLCGKAGGSTWEYSRPSRAAKPIHSSWEVTMPACKRRGLYENECLSITAEMRTNTLKGS